MPDLAPATLRGAAAVRHEPRRDDQAATLRRLFAAPAARVLPVLMPERHCASRSAWIARLAQGFARHGERTLVVDAVRAQVAAVLGLRARHDLLHVLRGECAFDVARVDAGHGLGVLPASRALAQLADASALLARLGACCAAADTSLEGLDLVLLLLPASAFDRLPAGDALVPLPAAAPAIARALDDLACAAQRADIGAFRLLFLGMDPGAAATLAQRIAARPGGLRGATRTARGATLAGAVQVGRDLMPVVRAAGGWSLARIELTK